MSVSGDEGQALPSFDIALFPTGDTESRFNFNHRNDPLNPWQRQRIMQRKDAFNIQCTSLDVVHGRLDDITESPATLLVLKFWFDSRKQGRRIASASIEIKFSSLSSDGERPEVYAISPHDRVALVETHLHREAGQEVSVSGGVTLQPAQAGSTYLWKKSESQDLSDATFVTGSIDTEDLIGGPNCASWTLLENKSQRTGVPSSLQVAVLLRREDMDPFKCTVDVKAEADWRTRLEWFAGSKSYDDPVLFNPNLPPTNKLRLYDTDNLASIISGTFWEAGLIGSKKPSA